MLVYLFISSLFPNPRLVRMRIEWIQRDFLCGGGALEQRSHLVKRRMICLCKGGGLGIKNLAIFNKVLLCKWSWHFASKREAFWNQVVRGKYEEEQGDWCTKIVKDSYGVGV